MERSEKTFQFWSSWLSIVVAGIIIFGLTLVVLPDLSMKGFSLLIYGSADRISQFTPEAIQYTTLTHAVVGSVLAGWGVALLFIIYYYFRKGINNSWNIVALSILVWFILDTSFSLASGFARNALLNLVFFFLFSIPLVATKRYFRK